MPKKKLGKFYGNSSKYILISFRLEGQEILLRRKMLTGHILKACCFSKTKRPASGSLDNASQELDDETVEDEEDETQLSFHNSVSPPTTPLSENSVLTVGSVLKEKQPTLSTSATGNSSKDLGYKKRSAYKIGEGLLEIEKQKLKMKQEKQVSHSLVNDEDVAFFTSLLPHVRKLSPVKKLQFRLNVQELFMKTAYGVRSREAYNSSNNVADSVTVPPPAQVIYDGDTSYIMLSNIHSVPTYINDNVTHKIKYYLPECHY